MSIKSEFYKLSPKEFETYLASLKNLPETKHFLVAEKHSFFYYPSKKISDQLIALHQAQWEFDKLVNGFSNFTKRQIVQSFLLDEIESTNRIENIHSTRHDIFSVMQQVKDTKDEKVISITNAYSLLLSTNGASLCSLSDIRSFYDNLVMETLSNGDIPDGKYFRHGPVHISDGIKKLHDGLQGEENIDRAMEEFLSIYNGDLDVYERMILCHFLLETVHPFYDGNGRLGRYLFSNGILHETKSVFAFLIAKAFSSERDRYYAAFKRADDEHEFGCLNDFVESLLSLLLIEIDKATKDLLFKKQEIENYVVPADLKNSQKSVYSLIAEATVFSDYGVNNEEIMKETAISKRTLLYVLNALRSQDLLLDTKIGKFTFHKLK